MLTRMTLMAVGLCLAAAPAMAGELTPVNESRPTMLSDAQMSDVVAGETIVLQRYLRTGKIIGEDPNGNPIYKQIDKPKQGGKMYAGEGPADNNGTTPFTDFDLSGNLGLPPGTLTADATFVGQPSNGRGAGFVTINLNLP